MQIRHQLSDTCPSCGTEIRFTEDAVPGQKVECAKCGAELTLTFINDQPDLRLSSEVTDEEELERYVH